MVNNSLHLSSGENATVRSNVHVTIDCKQLIKCIKDEECITDEDKNPNITWTKDGLVIKNESFPNVFISEDKRLVVIVARITFATRDIVGNDGNYTCKVCGGDGTDNCEEETSCLKVCGKIDLF